MDGGGEMRTKRGALTEKIMSSVTMMRWNQMKPKEEVISDNPEKIMEALALIKVSHGGG
jgi:hypothetical protein